MPPRPNLDGALSAGAVAVELTDVTSRYREGGRTMTALEGVSLRVDPGEIVALIGPSGSGKSTLLDLVAGLTEPDAGTVRLADVAPGASRLGQTAYMRQRDLLVPWRTVVGNAAIGLEAGGTPRREAERRVRERLPEFGLDGFATAWPAQLSGGMRQRVAFLRTVLPARRLLLLDEPFAALDALTRAELHDWLLGMWERERQAVLLVTHDVDEAVLLADRVLVLSARPGQVAAEERINLPRPRSRALVTDAAFVAHKARILMALDGSKRISA